MFRPLLLRPIDYRVDIFEDDDDGFGLTSSVPVAESEDGNRLVTLDCSLDRIGDPNQTWEFSFAITCAALDASELPFTTQDRDVAAYYIPPQSRPLIVPAVCLVAQLLVQTREPRHIYRVQKTINAPAAAQRKHELITSALQDIGYETIESGTDRFSRRYQVMQRRIEEVANGR